jgi:hypothetical protein
MMIQKAPIYVDLDRRREIVFDLNTEILIKAAGKQGSSLWETIGVTTDPTGKESRSLDVNLENLRTYLWAALQADAKRRGEIITEDEVGALLKRRVWVTRAVLEISKALQQYYGDEPGEA